MGRIQGDLKRRTFEFARAILRVVDQLPQNGKGWELGKQIVRSGTGIGANVCEADHAFTDMDFAHKCSIARKEATETHYWLELCLSENLIRESKENLSPIREADELTRIPSSIVRGTQDHVQGTSKR